MIQTVIKTYVLLICASFAFVHGHQIEISGKSYEPISVAINDFYSETETRLAKSIVELVKTDLDNSGLLKTVPGDSFISTDIGIKAVPFFEAWRKINATILVNGEIERARNNSINIKFKVWDIVLGKSVITKVLEFKYDNWRRAAHKIANQVYHTLTGEEGPFDSKIVYISEYPSNNKIIKRLAIMDQDGANHKYLSDGTYITISPKISSNNEKIIYTDFRNGISKLFLRHLYTGEDTLVSTIPGNIFSPRFSHDGKKILFSVAHRGSTHIFVSHIDKKETRRLTHGAAINTSPSYSPNDKRIIFNSDRSGSPQLYVMSDDGSNVQCITSNRSGGIYAEPSWSPRGDYVACTKIVKGEGFLVNVINLKSGAEKTITRARMTNGHCWSQNGHFLIVAKESVIGSVLTKRMYKVDLYGCSSVYIPTPHGASDPNWVNVED
ncbi:DPP IV N-terminal domain-containing protein [Candidatus Sneabacter namystus]|uniref:Tol-Pal system protein TolB n=1 Tax=Candidatus Sneabacter namystus TaxID=2601646 RepID=A0A5C0UIR6_9RICK|nr:DPP IV N-terminal domain-containing protein [Candidatus Sneabacter namystus]QEK39332.1 Tol-Pal system protein TolB [Candidatus Sneabacter namystus]